MKQNKKHNKIFIEKMPVCLLIFFMFMLGMLLYILSLLKWANWVNDDIAKLVKTVIGGFGLTIVSAACVSFILEISSLKKLIHESIIEVLSLDFPLRYYKREQLERFNKKMAMYRATPIREKNKLQRIFGKHKNKNN